MNRVLKEGKGKNINRQKQECMNGYTLIQESVNKCIN